MLQFLQHLLASYGYLAVAVGVMVESMGVPIPGETMLLLAAAYAGAGGLDVRGVIVAAALGAIVGDSIGYEIGRLGGRALLERYGHRLHLSKRHLAHAEAFFARHGDKTVFFGRFTAFLRAFSAFLAGVNRMPYQRFLLFNAAGGILWAVSFGLLGAAFGSQWPLIERWAGRAGLLIAALLLLILLAGFLARWAIQHETELRARWAAFLAHPTVVAVRTRFAPQIAFLEARLSPTGELGLQLTIGIVLIVLGSWLFGGIAEDIVHGDPLVQIDQAVSQFMHAHAEPPFTTTMLVTSLAGSYLIVGLSLLIGGILAWQRRWYELSMLVLASGGGELINLVLKALFARQRPTVPDPLLTLTSPSFPSEHAMASMIFYGLTVYLVVRRVRVWRWRVLAVLSGALLIILIGFSRIYLGVQYLSDVLGGYAAGFVWLAFTVTGVETLRRREHATHLATASHTSPP
jgi:membrane protein DedA with SNARE-associated domain/membrane-associated phospholipid phosphatase